MGQNLQTVIVAGADGSPVEVSADGGLQITPASHVDETIQVATATSTTIGTDKAFIAAPGSGVRIVLVGLVIVFDSVAVGTLVHWGTGTSDPVLTFDYITGGGIAYHWGAYGPKGGDNEALLFDTDAVGAVKLTSYYYTEPV